MNPILIVSAIVLAFVLIIIAVSYLTFRMTFFSNKKKHFKLFDGLDGELTEKKKRSRELIESLAEKEYQDVYTESYDGLRLHARYYHSRDGAPLQIQFHGYKSVSVRDFSGGAQEAMRMNHNLILVDERAHGESSGKVITFGIKERYDCVSWINYAIERFGKDVKIMLAGISMGAATVLMASELNLPENVVGIFADCPYSSPEKIIKKVCRDMKIPPCLAFPFIRLGGILFGRFDVKERTPLDAVKNTDLPILLIHGEGDDFVPVSMSDELSRAAKNATYVRVKDATHGLSYLYDYGQYMENLKTFTDKIFKGDEQ